MKQRLSIPILILAITFLAAGCEFSSLDRGSDQQLIDEEVWENPQLIQNVLNNLYGTMGHGLHNIMLASLSDEAHYIHGDGVTEIVQGITTAGYLGAWEEDALRHFQWGSSYSGISQLNSMIENIDDSAIEDPDLLRYIKGEAHFLRAYVYHNLLRNYGGVPIITRTFALDDDEFLVSRNTFAETVAFVVEEAERAATLLDLEPREEGRASAAAALALKSRVHLYAASDLFHDNPASEYTGYLASDRQMYWEAARDAAQDVMDLGIYSLFNRYEDPVENFTQLFLTNEEHEESIMSRFFRADVPVDGYHPGRHNGPNGYQLWGGNTPLSALADAFLMSDGTSFNWENPEHAAAPYENRDPRFYATILYDGADWRERPSSNGASQDPQGVIQTFVEVNVTDGSQYFGLDARLSPIQNFNATRTGYYLRKFIDPGVDPLDRRQEVPWRFFRYAEILLNYAEASLELGDDGEARRVLNLIRERAGMPEITAGGEELKELYRNERRVELAFEEHRYWDVRRWKIAPETYHDIQVLDISVEAEDQMDRETYFNYSYERREGVQARRWLDRMYFQPIPEEEMNRNSQLVQNPEYN